MSFYDLQILEELKGRFQYNEIRSIGDSEKFFAELERFFPSLGSKIDWQKVDGAIVNFEGGSENQPNVLIGFFEEMVTKNDLEGPVIYIGDSATDMALEGDVSSMIAALKFILSIPQHIILLARTIPGAFVSRWKAIWVSESLHICSLSKNVSG